MLSKKAARKSLTFFILKAANTGLATLWSFLLAYSLVRIVGLESYAFFATVIAFASLILQADLGISIRLFGQLRENYLHPENSSRTDLGSAVAAALWSYAGVAVLATGVFAALVWGFGLGVAEYRPVYLLLFAGSVLPLPWMVLRLAANAFDAYVLTEAIDCVRRSLLLLLTAALVIGLPLMVYAASFVLLWLSGLVVLLVIAQRRLGFLSGAQIGRGFRTLRADLHGIAASAALSFSEFLILIFPYYAIPLMHREALALVAFDMFYKVTRFATTAYFTVTETMLPHQTRAWHAGDAAALRRWTRMAFGIGAVPALAGGLVIGVFGDQFFGILLGHPDVVSPGMRAAICVMLALMLVQVSSGMVLAGIGWLAALARRAALTLAAMLVFSVITAVQGWSIERFIAGYVFLYGCEAFSYLLLLRRLFQEAERAPEAAVPGRA